MSVGQFVFMLHSHLPYYRKAGMWPFGEENLYEAIVDYQKRERRFGKTSEELV